MVNSSCRVVLFVGVLLLVAIDTVNCVPTGLRLPGEDENQHSNDHVRSRSPPPNTHDNTTDQLLSDDSKDMGVLGLPWSDLAALPGTTELQGKGDRSHKFRLKAAKNWQAVMGSFLREHHRQRRAHALPTKLTRDPKGYWTLAGLREDVNAKLKSFAPPPLAASMVMVEHAGRIFWLVTQDYSMEDPGSLHVYMLLVESDVLESTSVPTLGANHCQPVLLRSNFMEVVCVETLADRFPAKKRIGTGVYRVTWEGGLQVVFKRGLQTQTVQDVAVWNMVGDTFLAFANSYDLVRKTGEISSSVFRVKVTVMTEEEVYSSYDRLDSASVPTKHAMGVDAFEIQSRRFLAVANHKDDKGNVEIDSQIFVYDLERSKFRSFQRIRTSGARDWTAFSFVSGPDAEYFLAVANEYKLDKGGHRNYAVESVIYRYEENKFVPFQCVQTFGALHWAAYQGPNGKLLLAVANSQEGVFFYQYNGWTFVRTNLRASSTGVERLWIGHLPTTLHQVVLTIANPFHPSNRPLVLYIEWQYHNPLAVYHRESLAWCQSFKAMVESDNLDRVLNEAATCRRADQSYVFTRPVTISGNLTVASPTLVSQVDPIQVYSGELLVSHGFTDDIVRAFVRFSEIWELKDGSQRLYDNSKKIHQPNLDGHLFTNLNVECGSRGGSGCMVTNIVVEKIIGLDATFKDVIWLTGNNGVLNQSFSEVAVTGQASAKVAFLSGSHLPLTPTSHLVTLTGTHAITGEKTFSSLKANALVVSDTVDGVAAEPGTLLLTVEEQHVTGTLALENLSTPHLYVSLLNGQNFSHFYNDLVLKDVSQLWTGLLRVGRDIVAPAVVSTNPVTPLDPEEVAYQALLHTRTTSQTVTGLHTLGSLKVEAEVTVVGQVNGVRLPDDIFLRSGPEVVVHTPSTFVSITADNIVIHSNLNHVQEVEGRLAVLLLENDQVVTHSKVFADLHILGHSTVGHKVAGHFLQDLILNLEEEFVLGVNSGQDIAGSLTFHDALYVADDTLDSASLGRIAGAALPLNARDIHLPLVFHGRVQVDGDIIIKGTLNGYAMELYVLNHGHYTFTNAITFTDGLRVEGDVTTGKMIPEDVGLLASQLVQRNRNQTIHQDVYYLQPVMADLQVKDIVQVNGVDLEDVVILGDNTVITGRKSFTQARLLTTVNMGIVRVGHCGLVDDVIIDELFFTDTLRKNPSGIQTVAGRYVHTLVANSATGTDLGIFERTVVYRNDSEYIDGSLHFAGTVSVEVLTFGRNFDGVSAEDYDSGWLLKSGDQTLRGRNTLHDVKAGAVTFDGVYLQSVEWNRLLYMTAKMDETTTVQKVSFGLLYAREIILTGTTQGWDLGVHAFTASSDAQKITGRKTFKSMVFFSGKFDMLKNLVVRSTTQDDDPLYTDLKTFFHALVHDPATTVINSLTIRGNVNFGDTVRIIGLVNGEDSTSLTNEFWLSDLPASISSVASFTTVILDPGVDLELKALINGLDVETVWDTVLRQECEGNQVVSASFTLDTLTTNYLRTYLVDTTDDRLSRDLDNVLLTDSQQSVTGVLTLQELTAQASVQVTGTVNNLRVEVDLVRRGQTSSVTGRKIFHRDVILVGDLTPRPHSEVQGEDLSEFAKAVVVVAGGGGDSHTISGVTTFSGLRILASMTVGGRVDGVPLTQATVLLRTAQQTISGVLKLSAAVPHRLALTVHGNLAVQDNYFNDVDLGRLNTSTVRTQGAILVTGGVVFGEVMLADVWLGNHLVNGYNITDLALCLHGQHVLENMGNKLAAVQKAALDIQDVVTGRVNDLWYYKQQNLSRPLHMLQPVQLDGDTVSALVGLDRSKNLVHTYNISSLLELYPPIPVREPRAVAGMGRELLAVCGAGGMDAVSHQFPPTPTYTKVGNRSSGGYGHVYQLGDAVRLEAAFGVTECRDLVSFNVGIRQCLAVLDYSSRSLVMCRSPGGSFLLMNYLNTRRAIKAMWLRLRKLSYLLVVEATTTTQPAYLKVFKYDELEDQMVKIHRQVVLDVCWVSAVNLGSRGLVALTRGHTPQLVGQVLVLELTTTTASLSLRTLQSVEVDGAVQSSLSLMPTGEVGLYVQTRHRLLLYLLKGASLVLHREIGTTPALHPLSFPFLYEDTNTAMVTYTGAGLLQEYDDLPTLQLATPTIYTSVYKPLYTQ
ncbi:uncharacterized protein [Panulirus ornatus]|uniref:uncharacterized protein n=1 Tax=Panulirus ornatus TaxID=150431 RepID=UPI003A8AACE7